MKEIPLTQGKFAIVDDDMYDYLMQWKWYALRDRDAWYAIRSDRVKMHRLITDTPDGMTVDHIDGNGLNNTDKNLRICTNTENRRNRSKQKNNTTGYKGVTIKKGRYVAQLRYLGKEIYLGSFSNPIEAAKAYDKAAKEYHGEFAKTNF